MTPPDLRTFGLPTTWAAERPPRSRDPWYLVIRGRFGEITPHGPETLAVSLVGRPRLARKLLSAGCRLHQDGTSEQTLTFPVALLPTVAAAIKVRRKSAP